MKTGPAAIALIKSNEGCSLRAYLDKIAYPSVWTIGYGCTGPSIREGVRITQAQAEKMLADRLAGEFEPGVLDAIGKAPTTQNQFDAMISLTWNIGLGRFPDHPLGGGGFRSSSVLRHHLEGDYEAAAASFAAWNKAGGKARPGLQRRRAEEAALYRKGAPVAIS
jgi:lysozyme